MKPQSFYKFFKQSIHKNQPKPDQVLGKPQPPLQVPFKGRIIDLPKVDDVHIPDISLVEAIKTRASIRSYPDVPLTLEELAYALHMTQGIRRLKEHVATLRYVPSAGARHAFETYILVNNVEGLEKGIYRYLALTHQLGEVMISAEVSKKISEAALKQKMIEEASVTFIWVADSYRMTYRYGMRGYRYLFLDAGHVAQNLYLIAQQLHAGSCAIAAFDDDEINDILGLDGTSMFAIYMATLGKFD